jgi:hypothetical protein
MGRWLAKLTQRIRHARQGCDERDLFTRVRGIDGVEVHCTVCGQQFQWSNLRRCWVPV